MNSYCFGCCLCRCLQHNRAIDARTAYLDLWWSRDGINCNQSSFKTGTYRNQDDFSTMEPYLTNVQDEYMYLGKESAPFTKKKTNDNTLCEHLHFLRSFLYTPPYLLSYQIL